MENEKLRIINYPLSIFHFSLPSAIIDSPLIAGLTRNLLWNALFIRSSLSSAREKEPLEPLDKGRP